MGFIGWTAVGKSCGLRGADKPGMMKAPRLDIANRDGMIPHLGQKLNCTSSAACHDSGLLGRRQ